MKRLALALALAAVTGSYALVAGAQAVPPLPQMDATQSAQVEQKLALYRAEVDGRVARGEITAEEASRLLEWRRWQLAQEVTGRVPQFAGDVPPGPISDAPPSRAAGDVPPGPISDSPPSRVVREYYYAPPPAYYPGYYPPYYYAPGPYPYYYWGARVCAGGFGHHFAGRFCF